MWCCRAQVSCWQALVKRENVLNYSIKYGFSALLYPVCAAERKDSFWAYGFMFTGISHIGFYVKLLCFTTFFTNQWYWFLKLILQDLHLHFYLFPHSWLTMQVNRSFWRVSIFSNKADSVVFPPDASEINQCTLPSLLFHQPPSSLLPLFLSCEVNRSNRNGEAEQQAPSWGDAGPSGEHRFHWAWDPGVVQGLPEGLPQRPPLHGGVQKDLR